MSELNETKNKTNDYLRQIGKMKNDIEKLNKVKKDLIFEKTELEKKIIEENQVNKTEKESKDEELKRVRELMEGKSKDLKEKEKDVKSFVAKLGNRYSAEIDKLMNVDIREEAEKLLYNNIERKDNIVKDNDTFEKAKEKVNKAVDTVEKAKEKIHTHTYIYVYM